MEFVRRGHRGLVTAVGLSLLIALPAAAAAKRRRSPRSSPPAIVDPAAEPTPEPAAPTFAPLELAAEPVPEPVAAPPPPAPPGPTWLELSLGAALGGRHFSYTDPISANLRPYTLGGAPLLRASATLFPFGAEAGAVPSRLGVSGSFARSVGLTSSAPSGDPLDTTWQSVHLALLARIGLGDGLAPSLRPSLGLQAQSFSFDGGGALEGELPAVDYTALRAALGARFPGAPALELEAAWLWPLQSGAVAERFPNAAVGGLEATIGGRGGLTDALGLGLALVYSRFFYDLQPAPGDAFVAGGALDEYVSLRLELLGELR